MIPFVAAGGLLIALGFLLGGYEIVGAVRATSPSSNTIFDLHDPDAPRPRARAVRLRPDGLPRRAVLHHRHGRVRASSSRRWPATSPTRSPTGRASRPASCGRPGREPVTCSSSPTGAGFLGGIVGGLLAGVVAHWIAGWKVPTWARGLMPVAGHPAVASLIAGLLMFMVLGKPIAWLMDQLDRRPEQRSPAAARSCSASSSA